MRQIEGMRFSCYVLPCSAVHNARICTARAETMVFIASVRIGYVLRCCGGDCGPGEGVRVRSLVVQFSENVAVMLPSFIQDGNKALQRGEELRCAGDESCVSLAFFCAFPTARKDVANVKMSALRPAVDGRVVRDWRDISAPRPRRVLCRVVVHIVEG